MGFLSLGLKRLRYIFSRPLGALRLPSEEPGAGLLEDEWPPGKRGCGQSVSSTTHVNEAILDHHVSANLLGACSPVRDPGRHLKNHKQIR